MCLNSHLIAFKSLSTAFPPITMRLSQTHRDTLPHVSYQFHRIPTIAHLAAQASSFRSNWHLGSLEFPLNPFISYHLKTSSTTSLHLPGLATSLTSRSHRLLPQFETCLLHFSRLYLSRSLSLQVMLVLFQHPPYQPPPTSTGLQTQGLHLI